MFFELGDIQRLDSQLHTLQTSKKQLTETLSKSYTQQNLVRGSMGQTIQDIIEKANHTLEIITNIEQQAQNGFLVPEQFDIEELVYEKGQLPDWFQFVFKKQFLKQKKTFDVTAKKMYKMNGLREKKQELSAEIKSFQILYGRYQSLEDHEHNSINIMAQAETVKNKTRFVKEKFINFIHLISSKIVAFLEENISRSLNFSTQIQTFSHYNSIPDVSEVSKQPVNVPSSKVNFPIPPQPPQHFFESQSFYEARKPFRRQPIQTTMTGFPTDYGKSVSPRHFCRNHSQQSVRPIGEMRFNYRDHLNRFMGKGLSDYYV